MRRLWEWVYGQWGTLDRGVQVTILVTLLGVAVTVIVTLITALPDYLSLQGDRGQGQRSTAPTTPSSTNGATTSTGPKEILLEFVGEGFAKECIKPSDSHLFEKELAAIECIGPYTGIPEIVSISMAVHSDIATMEADYNASWGIALAKSEEVSNCGRNEPSEGVWRSPNDSQTAGRLLCYLDEDGHARLQWTYQKNKIHAIVITSSKQIGLIYDWWRRSWGTRS
jgi:hypothetical protein